MSLSTNYFIEDEENNSDQDIDFDHVLSEIAGGFNEVTLAGINNIDNALTS